MFSCQLYRTTGIEKDKQIRLKYYNIEKIELLGFHVSKKDSMIYLKYTDSISNGSNFIYVSVCNQFFEKDSIWNKKNGPCPDYGPLPGSSGLYDKIKSIHFVLIEQDEEINIDSLINIKDTIFCSKKGFNIENKEGLAKRKMLCELSQQKIFNYREGDLDAKYYCDSPNHNPLAFMEYWNSNKMPGIYMEGLLLSFENLVNLLKNNPSGAIEMRLTCESGKVIKSSIKVNKN